MSNNLIYSKEFNTLEMRLLILCSIYNLSDKQRTKIEDLFREGINWDDFYKLAVKNKIYPIIYRNLKRLNNNILDENTIRKFEWICKENRIRALQLTKELTKLMELFKQRDVRAISVKGPLLAMALYQDPSMRVSRDLDILVDFSDLNKANEILIEAGYTLDNNVRSLTRKQKEQYIKSSHHFSYSNNLEDQIELHWRLSKDYYNLPFEDIWDKKKEIDIFGRNMNVLSEEENLLYLIYHGSKHAWKRLGWLCDIYQIIKNNQLDWNCLMNRAEQLQITHMVIQSIILLKKLYGLKLHIKFDISKKEVMTAKHLAVISTFFIMNLDERAEMQGHSLFYRYNKYLWIWYRSYGRRILLIVNHFIPTIEDYKTMELQDRYYNIYYMLRFFCIVKKCKKYLLLQNKRKASL